jgi:hypothetical protein
MLTPSQKATLGDALQASLMLRYDKREVAGLIDRLRWRKRQPTADMQPAVPFELPPARICGYPLTY